MTDIETIRTMWGNGYFLVADNSIGVKAYGHIMTLLAEIDTLRGQLAQLSEESQTIPVAVDNDPPELVGPELVPAKHFEFYMHTRKATPWHSPDCPDCAAEPGIHDRKHREINDLTLTLWHGHDTELGTAGGSECVQPWPCS